MIKQAIFWLFVDNKWVFCVTTPNVHSVFTVQITADLGWFAFLETGKKSLHHYGSNLHYNTLSHGIHFCVCVKDIKSCHLVSPTIVFHTEVGGVHISWKMTDSYAIKLVGGAHIFYVINRQLLRSTLHRSHSFNLKLFKSVILTKWL